jgi:hypothetical protein
LSFLVAFAAGAIVAACGLLLESWSLGHNAFSQPALAAYMLLGGCITALARAALSAVAPREGNRINAMAVILVIVWANALYVVNVFLLAGEHYASFKSLLCDAW